MEFGSIKQGGGRSVLRYFVQLVLLYPAILIASLPFEPLLRSAGFSGEHSGGVSFVGYHAVICLLVTGPLVGWVAGRLNPTLNPTGRWVWVSPVALLLFDIVPVVLRPRPALYVPYLPEELFATGSNEGLASVFLTLPALSAAGYSLGMLVAGRWREHCSGSKWMEWAKRAVVVAIPYLAVLVSLFASARHIERDRIRQWSEIRYVPPKVTLAFTRDPNAMCGYRNVQLATGVSSLVSPDVARSLEVRACSEPRLLESQTVQENAGKGISLERVLVLSGPHRGEAGWVRAGGLIVEEPAE